MLRADQRVVADPAGPVVAVCTGARCAEAHRAAGAHCAIAPVGAAGPEGASTPAPDLTELRAAVRATRGAVLVSSGCLGRCDAAALVVLAWRGNAYAEPRPMAGMHLNGRMSALASWLGGPGPTKVLLDGGPLPPPLNGT